MSLAFNFAKLGAISQDMAFEVRFRAMQNAFIHRANDEIEKVKQADKTGIQLNGLEKTRKNLTEMLPPLKHYVHASTSNVNRLYDAQSMGNDMLALFRDSNGDPKAALTAEESAAINAKLKEMIATADEVMLLVHPDVTGANAILRLREAVNVARSMTAEEGAIPAEGDESPVNGNRQMYEAMMALQTAVSVGYSGALDSREQASELSLLTQTKLMEVESKAADLTQVGVTKVLEEVDEIKFRYANLLKVISLSYEASKGLPGYLESGLKPKYPEPGSIMNLFS